MISKSDADSLRRSTWERSRPKHLEDCTVLALSAESLVVDVPKNFDNIQGRDDEEKWLQAVNEEISSLVENKTWDFVPLPPGRKVINNKCVFRIKRNQDGNIDKYKARLVVKGCSQKKD